LTSADLLEYLQFASRSGLRILKAEDLPLAIYQVIEHEPSFQGGKSISGENPPAWTWTIDRSVRHYGEIGTFEEYVERVADRLTPVPVATPRVLESPLDLPTSLGYLNTAWRLFHNRVPLIEIHSPERVSSLAFDVGSREEFFDRIGALCDMLQSFTIPAGGEQKGGAPVERMIPYLISILADESHSEVTEALADLNHIRNIRNSGQHGEAEDRGASSYLALGISLPVSDWPGTWSTVRSRAINAFDLIRDALLVAVEDMGAPA
jgi:hypothetical protein